eukprot:12289315-Ditylum_brightwellii.AAC.1
MLPGRSQKRELRRPLTLTNTAGTGAGTRTRLFLPQLLPSRKLRMRISPQMRKRMTISLLASLPSSRTTGSDNVV